MKLPIKPPIRNPLPDRGNPIVDLDMWELIFGGFGGVVRRVLGIWEDGADLFEHPNPFERDVNGCHSENAVAKYYGKYWTPVYDRRVLDGVVDVGTRWQVRSSPNVNSPLWYRPKDRKKGGDDQYFFLVITRAPQFEIVGYLKGSECMEKGKFVKGTAGKPDAWAVSQEHLIRCAASESDWLGIRRPAEFAPDAQPVA
jgi:hypothetical protein